METIDDLTAAPANDDAKAELRMRLKKAMESESELRKTVEKFIRENPK